MTGKPVAAGKSSIGHIDQDLAFDNIIVEGASAYLDLACGVGRYTLALAERIAKGTTIYGIDLWAEGIAALEASAKEQGFDNIKAIHADATKPLPLEDASVDICFMATMLHDLPSEKREDVLRELKRILKPHGQAVLIEFKKLDKGPGPSKEHRIGDADAEALFTPLGFTKVTTVSLGEFTYLTKFSVK